MVRVRVRNSRRGSVRGGTPSRDTVRVKSMG